MLDPETYDLTKHIALEASAGTGKTYALTLRLINLLLHGISPDRIMALTFTNKAAQEMKHRLIKWLRDCLFTKGVDEKTDVGNIIKVLYGERDIEGFRRLVAPVYQYLLDNMSSLEIGTLDSFFSSIVRIFPFELGIRPDVNIADEGRQKAIFKEAITQLLAEIETDEELKGLIFGLYQLGIIKATLDVKGWLFSYLEKFWQFHQDVISSLQYKTAKEEICCFPEINTIIEKVRPYLKGKSISRVEDIFKLGGLKDQRALKIISHYLERRNRWAIAVLLYFYRHFLRHFEAIKYRENLITFLDLSWLSYRLLCSEGVFEKDRDFFYYRLDREVKHLLLDEFQDTSIAQWQILHPLVNELISGIGTRDEAGSFFYVGDKKQAIYRFRGGEARLFDFVKDRFAGYIKEKYLTLNHRSHKTIIDFVNNVFGNIKLAVSGEEPIAYPFIKGQAECEEPGYVELVAVSKEELPNFLAQRIKRFRQAGYRYQDIAILIRRQSAATEFLPALKAASIPYRTEAKVRLLASDSVKTCYNLLRFFDSPNEPIYLFNFLSSKVVGYRKGDISKIDISRPLLSQLKPYLREKIRYIWDMVDLVPLPKIIKEIYEYFNFFGTYLDVENLIQFLDIAHSFEKGHTRSLHAFLNYLDAQKEYLKQASESLIDAVQVMTVHKAKGLEFEVVILPETTFSIKFDAKQKVIFKYNENLRLEELFLRPNKKEISFSQRLKEAYQYEERRRFEDELNLLYVALTRAKRALSIIGNIGFKKDRPILSPYTWFNLIINALNIRENLSELKKGMSLTMKTYGVLPEFKPPPPPTLPPLKAHYPTMLREPLSVFREKRVTLEEEGYNQAPLDREPYPTGQLFGEAFHYAMAQIKIVDLGRQRDTIDLALSKAKTKYGLMLKDNTFKDIKRRMENILNNKELIPYFSKGISVFNECPIFLRKENAFYRVDRLVLFDHRIVIIDYKTQFSLEFCKKYTSQMLRYKEALRVIFPDRPCLGLIVYALEDEIKLEKIK